MNLNSGEIHRLNIKSLSKWPYLWRCCRCFDAQVKRRRNHPRNARVISAEELGTMSKNNLRGITLGIGPILVIHSLTLIISCFDLRPKTFFVSVQQNLFPQHMFPARLNWETFASATMFPSLVRP